VLASWDEPGATQRKTLSPAACAVTFSALLGNIDLLLRLAALALWSKPTTITAAHSFLSALLPLRSELSLKRDELDLLFPSLAARAAYDKSRLLVQWVCVGALLKEYQPANGGVMDGCAAVLSAHVLPSIVLATSKPPLRCALLDAVSECVSTSRYGVGGTHRVCPPVFTMQVGHVWEQCTLSTKEEAPYDWGTISADMRSKLGQLLFALWKARGSPALNDPSALDSLFFSLFQTSVAKFRRQKRHEPQELSNAGKEALRALLTKLKSARTSLSPPIAAPAIETRRHSTDAVLGQPTEIGNSGEIGVSLDVVFASVENWTQARTLTTSLFRLLLSCRASRWANSPLRPSPFG
jgi:hypothetical protein